MRTFYGLATACAAALLLSACGSGKKASDAEEKAARDRFEREVEEMVRQLNAGRAATERAAAAFQEGLEAKLDGEA